MNTPARRVGEPAAKLRSQRRPAVITGFLLAILTMVQGGRGAELVNTSHLRHLSERVLLLGDSVSVIDIYADYPTYKPVEAKGEGFACVDDAARAAVLLMKMDARTASRGNEELIRGLLLFVLKMQTTDGAFYNFIERGAEEAKINTAGETSRPLFSWWAARALWALGEGSVYYRRRDPEFEARILEAVQRSLPRVDSVLARYGDTDSTGAPRWLLGASGADATSELVLGLNALYRSTKDVKYRERAKKFCDGFVRLQRGTCRRKPYGAMLSWPREWHAWANSQSAAILELVRLGGSKSLGRRALTEVDCFLPRWAGARFFRSCDTSGENLNYHGQIAYNIRPAVSAAVEAFLLTRESRYKDLAVLLASWLVGNNTMATLMYDSSTGRCFDGSEDSIRVNRNSGAESTIEALLAVNELERIGVRPVPVVPASPSSFVDGGFRYRMGAREVLVTIGERGFNMRAPNRR